MDINIKAATESNARFFAAELAWLTKLIDLRIRTYFEDSGSSLLSGDEMPDASTFKGTYAGFIAENKLDLPHRLVLALALAPNVNPALLDMLSLKNSAIEKKFTEFGGKYMDNDAFTPTVQTALFILSGTDLSLRFAYRELFKADDQLIKLGVISLQNAGSEENHPDAILSVTDEYLEFFISGQKKVFAYSDNFPAQPITTGLEWADFVTSGSTLNGLSEVKDWITHGATILAMEGVSKRLKPGYKALFYGPPGTGKTLAATLLAKTTGLDVYRIDLSRIVSRYVGETEKNLAKVFDRAENRNWILFFDEADALFGKRTDINNSNDRFANQEVAYLLQRIEEHNGLVILATNLRDNIDKAFLRRFQSVIYFAMPDTEQRMELWQQSFSRSMPLNKDIIWAKIAQDYTLSGAAIANVLRYCCLQAIKRDKHEIALADIEAGIKREQHKEGVIF